MLKQCANSAGSESEFVLATKLQTQAYLSAHHAQQNAVIILGHDTTKRLRHAWPSG